MDRKLGGHNKDRKILQFFLGWLSCVEACIEEGSIVSSRVCFPSFLFCLY